MTARDRLTFYTDDIGEWRWTVRAAGNNTVTLASTQGYADRRDAIANAERYLPGVHASDRPLVFEVASRDEAYALDIHDAADWLAAHGEHRAADLLRDRAAALRKAVEG